MAEKETQQVADEAPQTLEVNEFESLLTKEFKPKSDIQKSSSTRPVNTSFLLPN